MKVLWDDVVMVLGLSLLIGTGFSTNYALSSVSEFTDAANMLESDPIAREMLNFNYGLMAMQMFSTAMLGGTYWLVRRKFMRSPCTSNRQLLDFFAIAVFLVFAQNFANDFSIALKLFMGG